MNKFVPVLFKINRIQHVRTFLSESYKCTEHWNNRLKSPILQKVRLDELSHSIETKFNRNDPVSPIDMDVMANTIKDENYLNELRDLLHKFRCTKETRDMMESTNYAAIRNFFEHGKLEDLIEILDDRLNYGLFLDDYLGNMLLDYLIKKENYSSAAKVASLFTVQEDFGNEITERLCLYVCYKYINSLGPEEPTPKEQDTGKKKKEEVVKVRVRYIINPFFDDNFDLTDNKLLAGKTICALTKKQTDTFSLNCQLIGWLFYKKIEELKSVSQKIIEKKDLLGETLKIVEMAMHQNHFREDPEMLPVCTKLLSELQKIPLAKGSSMEGTIVKKIEDALNKHQEEHIHKHSRQFDEWEKVREDKFKEQIAKIELMRELAEQKAKEDKLREIEEKLWFLDNEEKVDMKIEENEKLFEEYIKINPSQAKSQTEEYIPPEVKKRLNTK